MNVFRLPAPRYDDMALDGRTLELAVGVDGDYAALIGQDLETGKLYVLRIMQREKRNEDGR